MNSRKVISVLSPVASSRPLKMATVSAEYIEAIHVLNEGSLNQACELLLDDTNTSSEGPEKLLELYHKCEAAYKVIQKQQQSSPALPPGAPVLSNAIGGNSSSSAPRPMPHRGTLPKLQKKSATGVMPIRRTAKPSRVRERSDSDIDLGASNSGSANKKQRVSPTPLGDKPPPSALNFLAKLNKDPSNNSSNSNSNSNNSNKKLMVEPQPPKRKNPARTLHRRSSA